jgi:hypothetical protein
MVNSSGEKIMKQLSFLLLCLCLTGCLKSKVLLEDPAKCVLDKKLVGFWSLVDGKSKMIAAIGPSKVAGNPANLVCYQGISFSEEGQLDDDDQGKGQRSEYALTVTVGNYGYLCLLTGDFSKEGAYAKWLAGKDQGCEIYRYRVEQDTLTLWPGDTTKLAENGLKAEAVPDMTGVKTFSGTRAELIGFLKTKSDKLFSDADKIVFKRVAL